MKKKFLFIEPREFDHRELSRVTITDRYDIVPFSIQDRGFLPIICEGIGKIGDQFDPGLILDEMVACCEQNQIDGVLFSIDYPGALFASALIEEKKFHGPSMQGMLWCQHKYESRIKQRILVPEATPDFMLVDGNEFDLKKMSMSYPVFLKPIKSSFSILADKACDESELVKLVSSFNMPAAFVDQFSWFLERYSSYFLHEKHMLVEQCLSGEQVTLEGFIYEGEVTIIGVVDSVFFPNGFSFKQFEYPSQLPISVQTRMGRIAEALVKGFVLNNTLFNIELMYNPVADTIHIIEVHSRMSAQFADLYEKVDGTNSYDLLLMLAQGIKPQMSRGNGLHSVAASFVLRAFEDDLVVATPSMAQEQKAYERFPDMRFYTFVEPGMRLSDIKQDGKSYRYGLMHLGARDRQELYEKWKECKRLLPFKFGKA